MKKWKRMKRVWLVIFSIFLVSTIIGLTSLNMFTTLLPVIIPSGLLTFGFPAYTIITHGIDESIKRSHEIEAANKKKDEEFNKHRQEIRNKIQMVDAQFFNTEPFNELDFQEDPYVVLTDEQQEKDKVKIKDAKKIKNL